MKLKPSPVVIPGSDVVYDPDTIEERRRDSPHRETVVAGETYCGICGRVADADPFDPDVLNYHGDTFEAEMIAGAIFAEVDGERSKLGETMFLPRANDAQIRSVLLHQFWEPRLDAVGASAIYVVNREK